MAHLSKVSEVYLKSERADGSPAPLRAVMAAFSGGALKPVVHNSR